MSLLSDWCEVSPDDGHFRVRLPYLDSHRDAVEAFLIPSASGVRITDYGELIADLRADGVSLDPGSRRLEQLCELALRNGFRIEQGQIVAEVPENQVAISLHNLAHIRLFAQGLVMSASREQFRADIELVTERLREHSLTPEINVRVEGRSGPHSFHVSWRADGHSILARIVHRPDSQRAQLFAFALTDILSRAGNGYKGAAFLPTDQVPTRGFQRVARVYDIRSVSMDHIEEALHL